MKQKLSIVAVVAAVLACKTDRPLPEAIIGEWEVWCRTDDPSTSTCLGKENDGLFKVFHADGRVTVGARGGSSSGGTWRLTGGDGLVLELATSGLRLEEAYRARIHDDRLILWSSSLGFGTVLGRKGAPFVAANGPTSSGERIAGELGGLRYTLAVPAGYRLVRDDNRRQSWGPGSGDGFTVLLSVSERSRTLVDGEWVTVPCNPYDYGGISSSSEHVDGVERETSIGLSICIEGTELVMTCSTEHTRGYLEKTEKSAALSLCQSLELPS